MTFKTTWIALALALPTVRLAAQGDPAREIQQIAEAIERQLTEIDRLLQESSKAGAERSRPKELLDQAIEQHKSATDGIEKLIEKLNEMKNQSSNSQSQGQNQGQQQSRPDQQQGQPQGQGSSPRRENQNPDFVPQPEQGQSQPQPGEQEPQPQPQPQPGESQPLGSRDLRDGGQNTKGQSPPDNAVDKGARGTGAGQWGNLPPYLNFLKNRGATPKVPEKFRKYYEAYLKNKSRGRRQN